LSTKNKNSVKTTELCSGEYRENGDLRLGGEGLWHTITHMTTKIDIFAKYNDLNRIDDGKNKY